MPELIFHILIIGLPALVLLYSAVCAAALRPRTGTLAWISACDRPAPLLLGHPHPAGKKDVLPLAAVCAVTVLLRAAGSMRPFAAFFSQPPAPLAWALLELAGAPLAAAALAYLLMKRLFGQTVSAALCAALVAADFSANPVSLAFSAASLYCLVRYLAKAIAGEAGVPFFSISGSDFVEMYVGVGASRVRDLFSEAKKHEPCIVFIDEIDAVARQRGTGMGGGHDEREQTLNQLLVEMDGFGVNEGVIVIAATNRVDILDPAIMRPGRFDRKIVVGRPDVGGRKEILLTHAKNKPLGDDVNLEHIAQTTAGFTGADLENLLNEAAIVAAKDERKYICQGDINKAFIKVGIGSEKKSKIISDKEKKITAYHEAGHAILFHVLPDVGPVYTVSIIPTGVGAAGYTMPLPDKDEMFLTRGRMEQDIMVSLGGRIAEEIIFDDITTGASSDIRKATKEARMMVTRYGMSENIGVVCYDDDDDEVFIGRDLAHAKSHSENVAGEIDKEVKAIIDKCYKEAREIILKHEQVLHRCAELLLEKEKINREEFESLFVQF